MATVASSKTCFRCPASTRSANEGACSFSFIRLLPRATEGGAATTFPVAFDRQTIV